MLGGSRSKSKGKVAAQRQNTAQHNWEILRLHASRTNSKLREDSAGIHHGTYMAHKVKTNFAWPNMADLKYLLLTGKGSKEWHGSKEGHSSNAVAPVNENDNGDNIRGSFKQNIRGSKHEDENVPPTSREALTSGTSSHSGRQRRKSDTLPTRRRSANMIPEEYRETSDAIGSEKHRITFDQEDADATVVNDQSDDLLSTEMTTTENTGKTNGGNGKKVNNGNGDGGKKLIRRDTMARAKHMRQMRLLEPSPDVKRAREMVRMELNVHSSRQSLLKRRSLIPNNSLDLKSEDEIGEITDHFDVDRFNHQRIWDQAKQVICNHNNIPTNTPKLIPPPLQFQLFTLNSSYSFPSAAHKHT